MIQCFHVMLLQILFEATSRSMLVQLITVEESQRKNFNVKIQLQKMVQWLHLWYVFWMPAICILRTCGQRTCGDILSSQSFELQSGEYTIVLSDNITTLPVYCAFDYSKNIAYTLIESGNLTSYSTLYDGYLNYSFNYSLSYNENEPNNYRDSLYRMSKTNQVYIASNSDYLLSSCNFNIDTNSSTPDFWFINLANFDDIENPWSTQWDYICTNGKYNIRGYYCEGETKTYQNAWNQHLHIDSHLQECDCFPWAYSAKHDEDNFGLYKSINQNFTCSQYLNSTTNWWIGTNARMYKLYCFKKCHITQCLISCDWSFDVNLCLYNFVIWVHDFVLNPSTHYLCSDCLDD